MSSLKAVLINNYTAGSNLFSYMSPGSKTDPNLISGMFKALGMISKEFLGSDFSSISCNNGIKVLFGDFFINYSVVNKYLKLDSGFRFTEPLVMKSLNEFYLESSVPSDFAGKRFIFDDLLSKLDSKPCKFSVLDYESGALLYSIDYKPGVSYNLSEAPTDLGVNYCLIFDSADESLGDGSFVRSMFSSLSSLIKSNVNVFGPALLWGDMRFIDSIIKPLIDAFVVDYDSKRFSLFGDKIAMEMKLPSLDDKLKHQTIVEVKNILDVLNGSAKYLPKGNGC